MVGITLAPHTGIEGGFGILIAGEIFLKILIGSGGALVDGRVGSGADGNDGVGGETEEEEKGGEKNDFKK